MEAKTRSLNTFLFVIFGFYLFWLISENFLSHKVMFYNTLWTFLYHIFLKLLLISSKIGLSILGYEYVSGYNSLAIVGSYGVIIGNHCVGFGLSYGFAALIISYPGPWIKKLWYVPLGMLAILIINSSRVIALCTDVLKTGGFVKMEAHDLFNNIIYVCIFLLWLIWIKFVNKNPFLLKS